MAAFDLGSPLGIVEYGAGAGFSSSGNLSTQISAQAYEKWVAETRGAVATECGAMATDGAADFIDPACLQEGDDFGQVQAARTASGSM